VDELIVLSLQGGTTAEQELELRRWRAASPDHEARYQELCGLWAATSVAWTKPSRGRPPTLEELERRGLPAAGEGGSPGGAGRFHSPWARAALLVLGLGAGGWLGALLSGAGAAPAAVLELRTGEGEMASATLPDGTIVRLAPNTVIRSSERPTSRHLDVEGHVFLAVAPDAERPFRVRTLGGEAEVLGTRFEVDARAGELRLAVVEGAVAVSSSGQRVELRAGEQSRSAAGTRPVVEAAPALGELLEWMGAFVMFEATPLREVARELEARLGLRVIFADPALGLRTVTGWFADEDPEEMLQVICRIADVVCRLDDDLLRIGP
jgi:transmembrane sensor